LLIHTCYREDQFLISIYTFLLNNVNFALLSVCHLAGELVKHLKEPFRDSQTQMEKMEELKEELCVRLAGLCHDLGNVNYNYSVNSFVFILPFKLINS